MVSAMILAKKMLEELVWQEHNSGWDDILFFCFISEVCKANSGSPNRIIPNQKLFLWENVSRLKYQEK